MRLSEQRKLVVHDDSERQYHTIAALGDIGIAEPELQPGDPGDVPDDVEIATETAFITSEMWDACVAADRSPLLLTRDTPLYIGVDVRVDLFSLEQPGSRVA
jgi:hypothetical protein